MIEQDTELEKYDSLEQGLELELELELKTDDLPLSAPHLYLLHRHLDHVVVDPRQTHLYLLL